MFKGFNTDVCNVASYSDFILGLSRFALWLVSKIVSLQSCKFSVTLVAFCFVVFYYSDELRFLTISVKINKLEKPLKQITCVLIYKIN